MNCRYCGRYYNAKWRIAPDPDEEGKKNKPKLRHCNVVNKYISGEQTTCEHFEPHPIFYCDRNQYWVDADACINRVKKNLDEVCIGCSQYHVIVELQRARSFHKRKLEQLAGETAKPVLKRRTL